jgi:hypothetical protein
MKTAVAGACMYEVTAICTGEFPSISRLTTRHKWLAPLIIAWLITHFRAEKKLVMAE